MGLLKSKSVVCPVDQHCSQWARNYMGYCLCRTADWFSLSLGLISVVSWGVAEIPQIMTNYKSKSAEGLSILFLTTWIVGDLFNLFGCILEPATLPTQYYMAVLFLITTVLLFSQAVYYGHIYPRLKSNRHQEAVTADAVERRTEQSYGVDSEKVNSVERRGVAPSSPIPVESISPDRYEELFFMSARSLSVSHTPSARSILASRSPTSDVERHWLKEPLLGEVSRSTKSAPPPKVKTMLCVVSLMTFFLGSCNQQLVKSPKTGIVLRVGRRLFEAKATIGSAQETLSAGAGMYLGWGMAAIYMGGRLPQIFLNFRRGNAKGLNPLMFVFALVGNITYVASILVSSVDWPKIHPNLPWLVESGGCVLLDIFVSFTKFDADTEFY
ncbi:probable vacuolar amino acid transporter ypq1 [Phtheirospermum japonicum]|uniref:Probable vacuolar amino acid transporter ypq1 n=1 Tax=Phtheirospermum japonicum TaxID=374723 RepID=A0A830B335_9LAMI|nr:probable vacuolar amino acid transporter ypq1 [Phtheirospermum japonicum]